MTDTQSTTTTHGVELTDVAAGKVRSLLEQEGRDDLRLRVAVQPGGCSGLIYQLYFDERVLDGAAVTQPGQETGHRRYPHLPPPRGLAALLEERPPLGQRGRIPAHRVR